MVRLTGQNIEERVDPMSRVFPKMTKCTFHKLVNSVDIDSPLFKLLPANAEKLLGNIYKTQVWTIRLNSKP